MIDVLKDILSVIAIIAGVSIVGMDESFFLLHFLGVALLIFGLDYRYQERYR